MGRAPARWSNVRGRRGLALLGSADGAADAAEDDLTPSLLVGGSCRNRPVAQPEAAPEALIVVRQVVFAPDCIEITPAHGHGKLRPWQPGQSGRPRFSSRTLPGPKGQVSRVPGRVAVDCTAGVV